MSVCKEFHGAHILGVRIDVVVDFPLFVGLGGVGFEVELTEFATRDKAIVILPGALEEKAWHGRSFFSAFSNNDA